MPRFARTDRRYAPLCTALRSASPNTKLLHTALHSISTLPSTFLHLPLCMYTYTATDSTTSKNVRQFSSWLPPLVKKVMYGPVWPTMTSVVMVLNLFLNLLQICILQVPRRQPRPGDSVMGRRVAFQCDVDVLTMVLHESNPVFPRFYQANSWL